MFRFSTFALSSLVLLTTAACATEPQSDIEVALADDEPADVLVDADGFTLEAGTSLSLEVVSHVGPNATPAKLADEGEGGIEIIAVDDAPPGRYSLTASEPGNYWAIATDELTQVKIAIPIVVVPRQEDEGPKLMEAPDFKVRRAPPANGATPAK